ASTTTATNGAGLAMVVFHTAQAAGTTYAFSAGDSTSRTGSVGGVTTVAGPVAKLLVSRTPAAPVAGSDLTLTAQLADANGNPVATGGLTVTWAKTGSGGTFASPTTDTNASGLASVVFHTGTVAGTTYGISASDTAGRTGTAPDATT